MTGVISARTMEMGVERGELMERLKLAHAELRAEITLGWERQITCLLACLALTAVAGIAVSPVAARVLLVFAAFKALLGALIARISHRRCEAARGVVQALGSWLDIEDLGVLAEARLTLRNVVRGRLRMVDVMVTTCMICAALDVWALIAW